jgi:hypothetical protein
MLMISRGRKASRIAPASPAKFDRGAGRIALRAAFLGIWSFVTASDPIPKNFSLSGDRHG